VLAPEVKMVLETDPEVARSVARQGIGRYLSLANYANNLVRLGWSRDELARGGSDRLVDELVGWGGPDRIAERARAHLAGGADHLAIQVLATDPRAIPMAEWRSLAQLLITEKAD
jgi:probable F420-dependent oxidoreductase